MHDAEIVIRYAEVDSVLLDVELIVVTGNDAIVVDSDFRVSVFSLVLVLHSGSMHELVNNDLFLQTCTI